MQTINKTNLAVLLTTSIGLLSLSPDAHAALKGTAGQCANANKVNATWTYNWGSGKPSNLPAGVEFYPMWWSYYGATQAQDTAALTALVNGGAPVLLMYNEPDNASQA